METQIQHGLLTYEIFHQIRRWYPDTGESGETYDIEMEYAAKMIEQP